MGCCKSRPKPKTYIDVVTTYDDDVAMKVVVLDGDDVMQPPVPVISKVQPPQLSEFQQQLLEKQRKYEIERVELERVERQKLEDYFDLLVKFLQNELLKKTAKGENSLKNYYVLAPMIPESKQFKEKDIPTWFRTQLRDYFKKENCDIQFDNERKTEKLIVSVVWIKPKNNNK